MLFKAGSYILHYTLILFKNEEKWTQIYSQYIISVHCSNLQNQLTIIRHFRQQEFTDRNCYVWA